MSTDMVEMYAVGDLPTCIALERGWDACPTCDGLAYVVSESREEYLVRCLTVGCGRSYVAVIL